MMAVNLKAVDATQDETQPLARPAYSYPNFRLYLLARVLTTGSSEMQSVAVGWQLYQITHRALDLGLAGLAQFAPGILLFLLAGHVADHFPRRRVLQTCTIGFSLCSTLLLFFTLGKHASPWPIYAVLLLNGTVRAFNAPAAQSFLPLLLPNEAFQSAVALNSSAFQVAGIGGPMLAGVLYGVTGSPLFVYSSAGVAYLCAFCCLSFLQVNRTAAPKNTGGMVWAGLHYIWRNKLVLGAISLDLFAVLLGGATALLPVYAREILRVGPAGLGMLRSAPALGAALTSLTMARWPIRKNAGLAMLWCVFGFGLVTVAFGLSQNLLFSLALLLVLGATDTVSVIVRSTMIQLGTPNDMRGRVSAVNMVFVGASNEVGQFESGVTAHWFGTVNAVVLGGIGTMVIVGLWSLLFPVLRRLNSLSSESGAKS